MATTSSTDTLHIPDGIRFECSGCGNCCLQWPVPLTNSDVERISRITELNMPVSAASSDFEKALNALVRSYQSGMAGFRALGAGDQRLRGFTHTLEKRPDGKCEYLSESNRCRLHEEHGPGAKPSMCQLFPHAFAKTPSGVYAYVSFASTAALYNQGRLLTEQAEFLQDRYQLYKELFPQNQPDWSRLQIIDGHPMEWDRYLALEPAMLAAIQSPNNQSALDKLIACSHVIVNALPRDADPEKLPRIEARPSIVDQLILKHLAEAYLPDDVYKESNFDLNTHQLMSEIIQSPQAVSLLGTEFQDIVKAKLDTEEDCALEEILYRYVYARVFAKLYMGPNLAHFSLISGIHHLFFVVAAARLRAKQLKLQNANLSLIDLAEIVRTIERRLTQMNYSQQTSAIMEVLLSSPARLPRVRDLAR